MKPATTDEINRIPLLVTLGIRIVDQGEDFARMQVRIDDRHLNYFGGAHGGLLATLIDTACFFPLPLLPSGRKVTTSNLNVHYVSPATVGDLLTAHSKIVHLGKSTVSLVVRITDHRDRLVAHGSATLLVLKESEPPPGTLA